MTSTAYDSKITKLSKYTSHIPPTAIASIPSSTTMLTAATSLANNSVPITTAAATTKTTQIPSFQQLTSSFNRLHKPLVGQYYKSEQLMQQQQQHQQEHRGQTYTNQQQQPQQHQKQQHQLQQQQIKPSKNCKQLQQHQYHHHPHHHYRQYQYPKYQQQQSHLPQPVANNCTMTSNTFSIPATRDRVANDINNGSCCMDNSGSGTGGGIGSGGSSSASSTSPQSPPAPSFHLLHKNESNLLTEFNTKLYKKPSASTITSSPFLQRKYNNGCTSYKFGESPKKDSSMLSNLGQSIIRNLTTSPFSQKKNYISTATQQSQPQNMEEVRWPQSTSFQDGANIAYDGCNKTANKLSPNFGRNRFQNISASGITNTTVAPAQEQILQQQRIPENNQTETNAQHVHGNQSPIVLQRFYHQQNQLREREMERQQPYLSTFQPTADTINTSTNPFLNNFTPQPSFHSSQIPIASFTSSGSSQSSSTQSSNNSQISNRPYETSSPYNHHHHYYQAQQPRSLSPRPGSTFDETAVSGARSLQYQPLPQKFTHLKNNSRPTTASSKHQQQLHHQQQSPSNPSDEEHAFGFSSCVVNAGDSVGEDIRCQLPPIRLSSGGSGNGSSCVDALPNAAKENRFKDHHGWFNSLAGAVKRQIASYTKFHLNSAASGLTNNSSNESNKSPRSGLPFYRTVSSVPCGTDSTSPTNAPPSKLKSQFLSDSSPPAILSPTSFFKRFGTGGNGGCGINATSPSAAVVGNRILSGTGIDRRHRSPDPPPRYNRGQSPLLLRKNLLELSSGQPPGSPIMQHRRYVTASPPLPPPRRGSESVPGSPQHFRTRIHYTPEPQRRVYRTIDQ